MTQTLLSQMLDSISSRFPVREAEVEPAFRRMKASGMTFTISAYRVEGVGHLSLMQAKAPLGLMRMDSLILTPDERDMPLVSYDRMTVGGKDLLYYEFFNTTLEARELSSPAAVKPGYADLPDNTPKPAWYAPLLDPASVHKKFKKKLTPRGDQLTLSLLSATLDTLAAAPVCDVTAKTEKNAAYVEGLLTNGGPSTNAFLKQYGPEITGRLFRRVLFGTEK